MIPQGVVVDPRFGSARLVSHVSAVKREPDQCRSGDGCIEKSEGGPFCPRHQAELDRIRDELKKRGGRQSISLPGSTPRPSDGRG